MDKRIDYIDAAKGVGILLMILGHCYYVGTVPGLSRVIYSFHMPLFFIISGLFIKPLSLKEGVKKYAKAYLKPYLVACGLMLLLTIVLHLISGEGLVEPIKTALKSYLFASGSTQGTALYHDYPKVGMIWFLFALFWGCLFYSLIKTLFTAKMDIVLFSILLFFIGYCSSKYIRLPFSIQAGLCSVVFIMSGNIIRQYGIVEKVLQSPKTIISIMTIIWIVSALMLGGINMACNLYDEGIIQFPASIIATLLLFAACSKLKLRLSKLGQSTLAILIGHQLFKSYCWQTGFNLGCIIPISTPPLTLIIELFIQVFIAVAIAFVIKKIKLI